MQRIFSVTILSCDMMKSPSKSGSFSPGFTNGLYLYFRVEAPRYRRVSPVSGDPQRLIITKEVTGNIPIFNVTNYNYSNYCC